jgi:hypothetical protein
LPQPHREQPILLRMTRSPWDFGALSLAVLAVLVSGLVGLVGAGTSPDNSAVLAIAAGGLTFVLAMFILTFQKIRKRQVKELRASQKGLQEVESALRDFSGGASQYVPDERRADGSPPLADHRTDDMRQQAWVSGVAESALSAAGRQPAESAAGRQPAESAAGRVAEIRLSHFYERIRRASMRRSYALQGFGVVALVASFSLAYHLVANVHGNLSAAQTVARLSISVPGAVIFGYLTSEASAHRRLATWATQVAVQLESVSAFVARLDKPIEDDILRELGLKVFVGSSFEPDLRGRHSKPADSSASTLDAALRIAETLVRLDQRKPSPPAQGTAPGSPAAPPTSTP